MTSPFGKFHRYWAEWESKLKTPIERNAARLRFPALKEAAYQDGSGSSDGSFVLSTVHPICITNAPQKASSRRRGASHRNILLLEGGFRLRPEHVDPCLVQGHCSLSIFQAEIEDHQYGLRELDSMHFDMELDDSPTPYHPMFHVQRDISNKLDDAIIRDTVAKSERLDPNQIVIERSGGLGTQHLRLPTPQMDVFAVLTVLIADFFSNGGDKDGEKVRTQFQAILKLLIDQRNVVREGFTAKALNSRANGAYCCPAHWYPEHV